MILYRAAVASQPYFGRGSYWTASSEFAVMFRRWIDDQYPDLGPHVIFEAEITMTDRLEIPLRTWVESSKITSFVGRRSSRECMRVQ